MVDPVAVGGIVATAGALVGSLTSLYRSRRTQSALERLDVGVRQAGLAKTGALLCDYVDAVAIDTLASQYGVPRSPDEVERGRGSKSTAKAGIGAGGVEAGVESEVSDTARVLYKLRFDPNILTANVLDTLDAQRLLDKDLMRVPAVDADELNKEAAQNPGLKNVGELLHHAQTGAKLRDFTAAVKEDRFLLIENEWQVEGPPGGPPIDLKATQMGKTDDAVALPTGVSLTVPIHAGFNVNATDALITGQGRVRFQVGTTIRAVVFGRPGALDEGTRSFSVTPISIFSRVGRR